MLEAQLVNRFEQRLQSLGMPVSVEFWNGKRLSLGDLPKLKIALKRATALKALVNPRLGKIAQAYVEGDLDLDCDMHAIAEFAATLCGPQQVRLEKRGAGNWKWWSHTRRFDKQAISHHYDVSNEFFALWLDRQRVYSCAYFRTAEDSLELAQQQKLDHICRKLNLKAGERLLDIGCGWGALIFRAVEQVRRVRHRHHAQRTAICICAGTDTRARPRRPLRSAPARLPRRPGS